MELISTAIAVIGTGIAAYMDYKTGYISNKLTHSMILIGAILVPFITTEILYTYGLAAAVFGIGFALYSFGQIGGGDVKLFTAIALLLPKFPKELTPYIKELGINPVISNYPFVIPVFLLAGIIGPMLIHSIKNHWKILKNKGKIEKYKKKSMKGVLFSLLLLPVFLIWTQISVMFSLLFIPMAATIYLLPFKTDLVKLFYTEKKLIEEMDDDDVLSLEKIPKEKKEDLGLWRRTFTTSEIVKIKEKAKEKNYKEVEVCEGLPIFAPYIFIALIINLLIGDALLYIVAATI